MNRYLKLCKKLSESSIDGTVIVTVNSRLANHLRQLYSNFQSTKLPTWNTLDVLPMTAWIKRLAADLVDERVLLNEFQEKLIWEKIIRQSAVGSDLLRISETADHAQAAWRLIKQWQLELLAIAHIDDNNPFIQWAKEFEQACKEQNCLDEAGLIDIIRESVAQLSLPRQIILVGFSQIFPQLQKFLNALRLNSVAIEFLNFEENFADSEISLAFSNSEQEYYAMARWALQNWQQKNTQRIGCVIPNLNQAREQVKRIFTEVFANDPKFNISIGKKLSEYPLVHIALQTLQIAFNEEISLAELSRWLRSSFTQDAIAEFVPRAVLDEQLHQLGEFRLELTTALALALKSTAKYHCPSLAKILQNLIQKRQEITLIKFPSEWANFFFELLKIVGFPGDHSLDSEEYQTLQSLIELLQTFSGLDFILGKINYATALATFTNLTRDNIFQPETPDDVPIQILGILEANNLDFDLLWIAGMDELNWPPFYQANPFIPMQLQRQYGLPHATMEIDWEFYKNLIMQFRQSSSEIIFSYAQQQDEMVRSPSALIKHIAQKNIQELNLIDHYSLAQQLFATGTLEIIKDEQGPIISAAEKIMGGSNIIKYQAGCPFSAFAQFRLHATMLDIPVSGLDGAERGLLLHQVLEHIWNIINDQTNLLSYSEIELEKILLQVITETLQSYIPKRPLLLRKSFIEIELQRLKKIVLAWLNYEKQRPFFRVLAKEHNQKITLGNLELNIRIDRIDELQDGSYFIIDYKTGIANIADWLGERPAEPQLPLYNLMHNKSVNALAFGSIQAKQVSFNGVALNPKLVLDLYPLAYLNDYIAVTDWNSLVNYWQNNLTKLADEFFSGIATVDPIDPDRVCRYCEFKLLCRIYEKDVAYANI